MSDNIQSLIGQAQEQGVLSGTSVSALAVADVGQQIQEALGVAADEVDASEAVIVTLLIDDSGSIRMSGHSQTVRDGHNLIISSLKDAKLHDNVLVHCRYLNGDILYPYTRLVSVPDMDSHNYNPNGGTPLYDESKIILGTVACKAQEFLGLGCPVRTITVIISDGYEMHSSDPNPANVATIMNDLLKQETHIICGMGIGDEADFKTVFSDMGVRPEWILTPGNSEKEIRAAFQTVSDSAVSVSQSAQSFTQAALGGGFNVVAPSSVVASANP